MKRALKNERGLTLLEIILSLALLGIMVVSMLAVFTGGFMTIITMGNKSRADLEAQQIIDQVYAEAVFANAVGLRTSVNAILQDRAPGDFADYTDNVANFYEANEPNLDGHQFRIRFHVTTADMMVSNAVPILTVQVFYQNFRRSTTSASPIVR